ncbi:MAG: asparaginase [bacterium]|nr:asparaginase [Candidatus Kapabacteria bacterium]
MQSPVPLIVSRRAERVEAIHYGSIAIADPAGRLLFGLGDVQLPTYVRSSNKMIQALPVIRSGAADRFGFTDEEIAVCCASHSGARYHIDAVESMLAKIGLPQDALGCGPHEPADRTELARLFCERESPTAVHNNCSGKHAGMLATCLAKGWPTDGYLSIDHPLQQWILQLMSEHSGVPASRIPIAVDGCSLPTFYLPISSIATSVARYLDNALNGDEASSRIVNAIAAHPEMIYEIGGFDTELIRTLGPRCIAKRGAMAVFVVALDTPAYGPIGITVKLEDGNIAPMPLVVIRVLEQLGVLSSTERAQLAPFTRGIIENYNAMHVGDLVADFVVNRYAEAVTQLPPSAP